ncbi:nitroreductase family protein [Streptococcus pneumoniae]|uniref:nitroreductase family protein n=1 Tax=Streptococcus pneumoniae TaxID=1313 RepID=UPI00023107A8|nr:nitroreductase family protein [Streptococcus pneumoniae]EHE44107.1 nitroreductase family protein [Streptococcus pneumoniae GA47976]EHZ21521.1 nitroreductase family protein [Streptococcus pneumoniae GA13723]CTO51331.1 nitroreductase family protein [Streptococcus pneumoniae]CTO66839.1 nitroreductase family protein [Streptococcus pneumoniae]CTO72258.1 nitroreductase family protein [Streptococcus pneumoniae]
MTETIKLMKAHTSVRRFKEQEIPQVDLNEILTAAQMASSWKNFQSYSVIVVRSQEKKDALYELVPQEAIRQSAVFLLFVGDLNRAEKGARLHTDTFQPQGVEGLLISSVDAALAGQNALLAAESLGYGGVIIGLVRYKSEEVAELFNLPDYTYSVFEEEYQEQSTEAIQAYDRVQADYAGARATTSWSQRLAEQFGQAEPSSTRKNLEQRNYCRK